ncbi:MAG: hypothetical protein NC037_06735, partial [Bacteroides sp.]|nr:hypothetical protein [Bacteroides sp.]
IYCDMRFGNVNWNTRQDLKQVSNANKGSLIVAFSAVGIGCIALVSGILLATYAYQIGGKTVVLAVFWSVLFALTLAMLIAGILVLKFKAEPYYDLIGERKFSPKSGLIRGRANSGNGNTLMK